MHYINRSRAKRKSAGVLIESIVLTVNGCHHVCVLFRKIFSRGREIMYHEV